MKKEHILAFRKKNNLTQLELGALLGTNLPNISAYERGATGLPAWFVEKFAELSQIKGVNLKEEALKLLPKKEAPKKPGRPSKQISPELLEDTLKGIQNVVQEKAQKQSVTESETVEQVEEPVEQAVAEQVATSDVVILEKMSDNRPASEHYHTGKIDVWAFADENYHLLERIGFHRVSALKYIARFGKKGGYNPIDLDKAIVELQKLKELTKGIQGQEEIL